MLWERSSSSLPLPSKFICKKRMLGSKTWMKLQFSKQSAYCCSSNEAIWDESQCHENQQICLPSSSYSPHRHLRALISTAFDVTDALFYWTQTYSNCLLVKCLSFERCFRTNASALSNLHNWALSSHFKFLPSDTFVDYLPSLILLELQPGYLSAIPNSFTGARESNFSNSVSHRNKKTKKKHHTEELK